MEVGFSPNSYLAAELRVTFIYFESQTKQFYNESLQVLKSDREKSPEVRETFKSIESGGES